MHGEILPEEQQNCLRLVGPAADALGFHLAGGTAVALHLGHRQSIDFDWFCEQFPERPEELADAFRDRGVDVAISSLARHTLHGTVGGVRVSFLMFRAPLLEPLVACPTYGCKLASLADLAAMKLLAVSQRGTKKDFIDVAALGRRLTLPQMLECYRTKFGISDVSRVIAGLCYFDDAEADPLPLLIEPSTWEETKSSLCGWVKAFADGGP